MLPTPLVPSSSESNYLGMSDEEELRRLANGQPVGEVFVDMTDDLRELGIEP